MKAKKSSSAVAAALKPVPRTRREVDPMFRIALLAIGVVTFLRLL